jgi:hypothetical protein
MAKSEIVPLDADPATTIFPSDWMAAALAEALLVPKAVVTLPLVLKVVSSVPGTMFAVKLLLDESELLIGNSRDSILN